MAEMQSQVNRMDYLDKFRIFLTITVIFHHTAIAYGGSGGWAYMEGATDSISPLLLTLFNVINQSYFMSAFFFMAGFFTPRSLEKKGSSTFLVDRLIRLGIPILVFSILLLNLNNWILVNFVRGGSFRWVLEYNPGHLWFTQALLFFAVAFVIIRVLRGGKTGKVSAFFKGRFPSKSALIISMAVLGLLTFVVRIAYPVGENVIFFQLGHFVHYTFSFSVGVLAYRGDWLSHLSRIKVKFWGGLAAVMIPVFLVMFIFGGVLENSSNVVLFMGGFHWQSLAYAMWESVMLIAMMLFMLSFFKKKLNNSGPATKAMAAGSYTVYIIHATIVIALQVALRNLSIPSVIKFVIVGSAATTFCYFLSYVIRKIPFSRRVLG